eukprot:CAMPEP_0178454982 /NCGR_PEP_ID=MMETSP0689_2-20121128/45661_1 /TAXON_ID=160604 /ORGANISM="Amphidinium massartii, Strain CS-259" /LENGTH=32 /DNA_ID= /DNA_START= /DNA_END= /DNA_ORIENTATION=
MTTMSSACGELRPKPPKKKSAKASNPSCTGSE